MTSPAVLRSDGNVACDHKVQSYIQFDSTPSTLTNKQTRKQVSKQVNTVAGFALRWRRSYHKWSYDTSSPVSTWIGDDLRRVYHLSIYPGSLRPTQPGHPSVGGCNEYWRWFRPSMWEETAPL